MQAHLRPDPARGAGYGVLDVHAFEGREADVLFSLRRASDGKYLGSGDWLEAEQRLAPDVVQYQGDVLRLLVGPAVVDMVDVLNTFAVTVYPAAGEGLRCGLEVGDIVYSRLTGGQGMAPAASTPLSMSPMPEMLLDAAPEAQPEPEPSPAPEPEPQLPVLKDPVEPKSKTPLILLLLLACTAGGVYWWKSQNPDNAPSAASAPQAAPLPVPSGDLPPLQRARELLRAGVSPEQAVALAKDMQTPDSADGAFLLLEDAAQKGSPEAMLGLARFYDPADASPRGSIRPDPAQARDWYNKARDKGQGAAEDKLKALRAWAEAEKDRTPQAKSLLDTWQ
ncbi:MAG: sel1 repeat family protein [Deltaproteobacteria bacterium]|jgi:hypothetical protein|nr:sel1 repeat family protein [Deltaproteobacteria bacterium]